jgi:putative flippase GtrA
VSPREVRRVGGEALRFGLAGIVALVAELAAFAALVAAGMSPLIVNPVTMAGRLGVAFWLTRTWVFRDGKQRRVAPQVAMFIGLAVVNMAVVQGVLSVATALSGGELASLPATVVKAAAIGLTFAGRFSISRRYVFGATTTAPTPPPQAHRDAALRPRRFPA